MDLFLFYLFFEVSLVPMYFLIGVWGGENRLYAAIKFFLYTLVGSVVMLLGVLKMYFLNQDVALTSQIAPAHSTSSTCRRWDRCSIRLNQRRCRYFSLPPLRSALRSKCRCFRFTRG